MSKEQVLQFLKEIDTLLSICRNPALTRDEHGNLARGLDFVITRVILSYKLEEENKDKKEEVKGS